MADEGGVWRTISGRRIFIKDGQSLTDAMRDSGKFGASKNKSTAKPKKQAPNMALNTEFGAKRQGRVMKR